MPSTQHHTKNPRPNVRPSYIFLGTDVEGWTHVYRTIDETIFALDANGRIEYHFDLGARTVDDYVEHVADTRAWLDLTYGESAFVDQFGEVV